MSSTFATKLGRWAKTHGRTGLAWQVKDPYWVWLSEIMLQQTQVETVKPYFERFTKRFPTVGALAAATEEEVLSHWAGLGYYARGRNLRNAALMVVGEFNGKFPSSAKDLQRLPGVGPSTAAAIASICFGERVSILDGNAARVISRYEGYAEDLSKAANLRELWARANKLVPARSAGAHTQALMDLGASLCSPKKPKCLACPLAADCQARLLGLVEKVPNKGIKKKEIPLRKQRWGLITDGTRALLEKNESEKGVWRQMLLVPSEERALVEVEGLGASSVALGGLVHKFTHYHLSFDLVLLRIGAPELDRIALAKGWRAAALDAQSVGGLALPTPVAWSLEKARDKIGASYGPNEKQVSGKNSQERK